MLVVLFKLVGVGLLLTWLFLVGRADYLSNSPPELGGFHYHRVVIASTPAHLVLFVAENADVTGHSCGRLKVIARDEAQGDSGSFSFLDHFFNA